MRTAVFNLPGYEEPFGVAYVHLTDNVLYVLRAAREAVCVLEFVATLELAPTLPDAFFDEGDIFIPEDAAEYETSRFVGIIQSTGHTVSASALYMGATNVRVLVSKSGVYVTYAEQGEFAKYSESDLVSWEAILGEEQP